ncbi:hypothetical protein COP2_035210 [Malus domestica]
MGVQRDSKLDLDHLRGFTADKHHPSLPAAHPPQHYRARELYAPLHQLLDAVIHSDYVELSLSLNLSLRLQTAPLRHQFPSRSRWLFGGYGIQGSLPLYPSSTAAPGLP